MKRIIAVTLAAPFAALLLAGCEPAAPTGDAAAPPVAMPGMPNMPQATPAGAEHMAEGTVNSIDRAAGTVNISHGPVASAGWPAMTMTFKVASPSAVENLVPQQRVEFQFTIAGGMDATVTRITAK